MDKTRFYEALFNQTSDCVVVFDLQGRVIAVNKKFEELHQWEQEEIVGEVTPMVSEEDSPKLLEMFQRIMQGDEISGVDIIMLRKDGNTFFANVSLFPLRDEEGGIIAFVGIGRDVTENKKAEELLRKSEKLSVVGELAAGIAHEIRNPLTSLKGFMQLLKTRNTDYVDIMLAEIERINRIVDEFMSLAKPHSIHFVSVNLNKLIEDVVSFMQPQAHLHGVDMLVESSVDMSAFTCEPNQMKQLFINLIKNAIEAMPNGGIVSIALYRNDEDSVGIKIADQGEGITEDGLVRLGEPFYSAKENGTGLGLVICHRIVEAHQGTLSFESKLKEGTTVEIVLPVLHV
ncbi:ATP-binding protein [Paenibacillus soyae]|uniref:histidine kinase n=1 Tax=Paenibacillus soyae TaxID=2969249 RepID=A0A9X2SEB5_9BACL|nr:ATP-binding protein [Paenibacillus soyae]MCR2808042.1 PAS domain S-box protein [Paenibacillus soyae]